MEISKENLPPDIIALIISNNLKFDKVGVLKAIELFEDSDRYVVKILKDGFIVSVTLTISRNKDKEPRYLVEQILEQSNINGDVISIEERVLSKEFKKEFKEFKKYFNIINNLN